VASVAHRTELSTDPVSRKLIAFSPGLDPVRSVRASVRYLHQRGCMSSGATRPVLRGKASPLVLFLSPTGTISSTARHLFFSSFRRCRDIVSAKHKTWCGFLSICPKLISRASQSYDSPMLFLTVEGPKVPLSRGALWICCAAALCGGMRLLPEHTSTRQRLGPR
jgi:hypothetical protein